MPFGPFALMRVFDLVKNNWKLILLAGLIIFIMSLYSKISSLKYEIAQKESDLIAANNNITLLKNENISHLTSIYSLENERLKFKKMIIEMDATSNEETTNLKKLINQLKKTCHRTTLISDVNCSNVSIKKGDENDEIIDNISRIGRF